VTRKPTEAPSATGGALSDQQLARCPLVELVQATFHRYRALAQHYASNLPVDETVEAGFRAHARVLGELTRRLLHEGERLTGAVPGVPGSPELLDYCLGVFGERDYCLLDRAPVRLPPQYSPFSFVRWVERFQEDVRALRGQRIGRWLGTSRIERGVIDAEVRFESQRSGRVHRRALYVPIRDREVLADGAHDQGVLVHWNIFDPVMANLDAYESYSDANVQQGRVWRTDWGHHHPDLAGAAARLPPDHIVRLGDLLLPIR
jgi:hypothetical protein